MKRGAGRDGIGELIGVDVSARSLEVARRVHGSDTTQFFEFERYAPPGNMDLVFCNGVFHHIPLHERATAIDYIYDSLRPGELRARLGAAA